MQLLESQVLIGDLKTASELQIRMSTCELGWLAAICSGDMGVRNYWRKQWNNARRELEELKRRKIDERHRKSVRMIVHDLQKRGIDASIVTRVPYITLEGGERL